MFGKFFTSYDEGNKDYRNATHRRENEGQHKHSLRRRVARGFEKSIFAKALPKIASFLLRLSVRDYGVIFFSMGVFASLLYPLREVVIIPAFNVSLESLIMGLVIALFALPSIFSSKPFAKGILTSRFLYWLCFEFLGFNEESYREASEKKSFSNPSISVFVGAVLGILSYFSNPFMVLGIILVVFLAFEVINTPETGIILILLALPFANEYVMAGVSLFVVFAYSLKCIVGKRTFKLELMDIAIFLLFGTCLYGGLVSLDIASSIKIALIDISLVMTFFLISNLVRSKEWYGRALTAMLTISSIVAISAIIEYVLGVTSPDLGFLSDYISIKNEVTLGFISPDALAIYLVASIPFTMGYISSSKRIRGKIGGFILYLISIAAIVMTFSRVGYVAGIVVSLLMLLIYNKNAIYLIFAILVAIPILNYTLPLEIKAEIASIGSSYANSHAYQLNALYETIDIIKAHPFGIGFGENAFNSAISGIGGSSVGYIENLFLQLLISTGIIGVLLLVTMLVVFARLSLSFLAKAKHKVRRSVGLIGFSSVVGIICAGYNSYAFADKTIFLMFIVCIALTFAYAKIDRANDKVEYGYIDITSSNIEIELAPDYTADVVPTRKYVHSPRKKKTHKRNREHKVEEMINRSELISVMGEFDIEEDENDKTRY